MTPNEAKHLALNMLCSNHITPREMEIELAKAYLSLDKQLAAAMEVIEAVRYCGARIETIGHGFDARNVYVVDLKLMEKIGDALQKFDKASEKHSKEKE